MPGCRGQRDATDHTPQAPSSQPIWLCGDTPDSARPLEQAWVKKLQRPEIRFALHSAGKQGRPRLAMCR